MFWLIYKRDARKDLVLHLLGYLFFCFLFPHKWQLPAEY